MGDMYGKGPKGKATRLHAKIVRSLGYCENCGTSNSLQCAHIISRKYSHTRTMLDNAFCLCASCHGIFTDNPVDFGEFTMEKIGEEKYYELVAARNKLEKFDWDEEVSRLQEIAKERGIQ